MVYKLLCSIVCHIARCSLVEHLKLTTLGSTCTIVLY